MLIFNAIGMIGLITVTRATAATEGATAGETAGHGAIPAVTTAVGQTANRAENSTADLAL